MCFRILNKKNHFDNVRLFQFVISHFFQRFHIVFDWLKREISQMIQCNDVYFQFICGSFYGSLFSLKVQVLYKKCIVIHVILWILNKALFLCIAQRMKKHWNMFFFIQSVFIFQLNLITKKCSNKFIFFHIWHHLTDASINSRMKNLAVETKNISILRNTEKYVTKLLHCEIIFVISTFIPLDLWTSVKYKEKFHN